MAALAEVTRDEWIAALQGPPAVRDEALAELHALLLRAARFELGRRRAMRRRRRRVDDMPQAADDALVARARKLDTFRGASRFTTWAYKFALLEAGVKARRRAWQDRELPLTTSCGAAGPSAQQVPRTPSLLRAVRDAMREALTRHQREVFVALALNGVPIDVLAERLETTRGALYKTLHDARRKLARAAADTEVDDDGLLGPTRPEVELRRVLRAARRVRRARARGRGRRRRLPGMRAHLEGCPACHEEHESLRELRP